ncbi:MAG: phytanoyl-CoA dioxygenase family protein [Acidiferrobacterales bacterium]|nr:phytanoyl-CoA dioxygenase family protein [Acidiferrobacterales bacterium]
MIDTKQFSQMGIVCPAGQVCVDGFEEKYYEYQSKSLELRGKETYLKPHLVSPWLDNLVREPVIVDAVEQLLGPDIVLWESDWSVKRAGTGDYVPWHQDSPYWNLSTDEVVSVWLAISEVTEDNGPMRVVPGSHREGQIGKVDAEGNLFKAYEEGQRTTDENCMFPFAHLAEDYDEQCVSVILSSGEFSIHSVNLIHGGGANPSNTDRIGFAMRFISANTRYRGNVDSVTPIRGNCDRDYFVFEPRPQAEFSNQSLVALEKALTFPSGFGEARRLR